MACRKCCRGPFHGECITGGDCYCPTGPYAYQVTFAGITGTNCDEFNRTWTTIHRALTCSWFDQIGAPGDIPSGDAWRVVFGTTFSGTNVALQPQRWSGSGWQIHRTYSVTRAAFDCCGSTSLPNINFPGVNFGCSGWPASIIVTAVNAP